MSNVIGYKGNSLERHYDWIAMLLFREGFREFKNSVDPIKLKIANSNKENYDTFLTNYIKKAA